jgi:hypothetical protein
MTSKELFLEWVESGFDIRRWGLYVTSPARQLSIGVGKKVTYLVVRDVDFLDHGLRVII